MYKYRVTYSGKPSGEIGDRWVLAGNVEDVPTWDALRASGEIPDDYEFYGSVEFTTEQEAREYAEYRSADYEWVEERLHNLKTGAVAVLDCAALRRERPDFEQVGQIADTAQFVLVLEIEGKNARIDFGDGTRTTVPIGWLTPPEVS